jgi:DNA-binding transcriptional ArsR family regulator
MNKTTKDDPKKADAAMLAASLKALSHPVRREILALLKDPQGNFPEQILSHDLGVCAGQIERRVGLSQSTVSAHLALLQKAGLLVSQKVGQWSFFRRDEAAIRRFVERLESDL